jgi:hypothetical protein
MLAVSNFRSMMMNDRQEHHTPSLPVANYSSAIAKAVEWLGDRYLLAKPIKAAAGIESHAGPYPAPRARHRSSPDRSSPG